MTVSEESVDMKMNISRGPGLAHQRSRVHRFMHKHSLIYEIVLLVLAVPVYTISAGAAPARDADAFAHGWALLRIEELLHVDIERSLNYWVIDHPLMMEFFNHFYTMMFGIGVGVMLLVMWIRDRDIYRFYRSVLFVMTYAALVTYWLFPVAPPRHLPTGNYIDTVRIHDTFGSLYGEAGGGMANEYGAMPSMHTAWAIWVAVAVFALTGSWWIRTLAVAYPIVTVAAIIVTANHYLLDAVAGSLYFAVAYWLWAWLMRVWEERRRAKSYAFLNDAATLEGKEKRRCE